MLTVFLGSACATYIFLNSRNRPANAGTVTPSFRLNPPVVQNAVPADAAAPRPRRQKPPIQDPQAREALSHVGTDLVATAYWMEAINNPNLPGEERKDLIEDLNEDGFSDKKRPAPADLPLIETRITLIELLAPNAMDEVNAEAFQEAYKDLINMRARLTGVAAGPIPNLRPR